MKRIYEMPHCDHRLAITKQISVFVSCLLFAMTSMAGESLDALRKRARNRDKDAVLQLRERLEPLANAGDAKAMIELADWYNSNLRDECRSMANKARAFELYLLAAAKGAAFGMYSVGNCYYWGSGVTKNREMAAKWYRKAADHGCYKACEKLSWDVSKGEKKNFWRKAADKGISGAYLELAYQYKYDNNYTLALSWYRKILETKTDEGDLMLTDGSRLDFARWRALTGISELYESSEAGLVRNSAEALESHRRVAAFYEANRTRLGLDGVHGATSHKELAEFYFKGWHVPMDYAKGVKFLKVAAEFGYGDLCHKLACYYMLGLTGPVNGDFNRMVKIVEPNQDEALRWTRKGAKWGDYDCIHGLCVSLLLHKRYDEARKWLEEGANMQGEHEGFFKYYLALCYLQGDGCTKDVAKARRLLKESAQKGFNKAIDMCKRAKLSY